MISKTTFNQLNMYNGVIKSKQMQNKRGCKLVSERVNSVPYTATFGSREKIYTKNRLQTLFTPGFQKT
jgi:hypothetical protein